MNHPRPPWRTLARNICLYLAVIAILALVAFAIWWH